MGNAEGGLAPGAARPDTLIDAATVRDLPAIAAIDASAFSTPWSIAQFQAELDRPQARLIALRTSSSLGPLAFINYWVFADEATILKIATHRDHRRRGLANRLLRATLDQLGGNNVQLLTLEVRRDNTAAQALYGRLGFEVVGARPRYYPDGQDALLMDLRWAGGENQSRGSLTSSSRRRRL